MKINIGKLFRDEMKNNGIKQGDIAEKLGIDNRNVSKALKNFDENKGNISTLFEYAAAANFDVNIEFIYKSFYLIEMQNLIKEYIGENLSLYKSEEKIILVNDLKKVSSEALKIFTEKEILIKEKTIEDLFI